ncbi:MAG: hypothetical protein EA369_10195 [Bradymonadales bacterium]|nr:MAG: hypothetical protein EA369_10195 [Bradymonadales bacterium]
MRGYLWLFGAAVLVLCSSSVEAVSDHKQQLLKAQVFSERFGNALVFQRAIRLEEVDLQDLIHSGPSALAKLLPGVRLVQPFKLSDGRRMLYLKVQGLAQAEGLVLQVREGWEQAFAEAPVWEVSLPEMKAYPSQLAKSPFVQALGANSGVLSLQGPLNETMDLAGLQFLLEVSTQNLEGGHSVLSSQLSLYPVRPPETLGDYLGMSERRLSLAELGGRRVMEAFVSRLK